MGTGDNAGATGRTAGELDCGLDGLGAGIGEEHLVQIWHMFQQAFRQHAGERGHIKLNRLGKSLSSTLFSASRSDG